MDEITLGVTLVREHLKDYDSDNLEDRVRQAMEFVLGRDNIWFTTNESLKFSMALGGALASIERYTEEYEILGKSIDVLKTLSAAISGVPVNFDALLTNEEEADSLVPIHKIWQEVLKDRTDGG